jgi:hypothetical protein
MCVSRVVRIVLVSIICAMANVASATLVGYYGLNEPDPLLGTTAVDSSPSAQNGTYLGEATPTSIASVNAGLYGTAVHFDSTTGNTSYVDIPSFTGLTDTGAFTYAAWINPDATQRANPNIFGNLNINQRGYDFRIALPTGGDGSVWNLKLNQPNGAALPTSYVTTATIPSGVWTHVAVTKDVNDSGGVGTNLSNIQFYVNGSLVESSTIGLTGAILATHYYIGAGRSATQYFGGGIDEVRIYDEVLDGTAIAGLAALPGVPGDYNNDGKVNAADYVVWRKTNINGSQGYTVWRQNFGKPTAGSGSGLGAAGSVPEPAGLLLFASAIIGACVTRPRR